MSSTNKTKKLNLNSWIGSDKPERIDFNTDNEIIEQAICEHTEDTVVHIDESERDKWNNYMYTGMYYGDGSVSRVVETNCPFEARIGFVFANNRTISIARFSTSMKNNYLGIFGFLANTLGVRLNNDRKSFTVNQSPASMTENEYSNLNEASVAYHYVMFR
ncbi:MAG: hypothetical protein J1E36_05975 [Eubacterium sp.]|nr:hypothetical protein [Eubacterium sp.]